MTRKAFIADVASTASASISGVSRVVRGAEDGELDFSYAIASENSIDIHVLALDVSGYPSENTFMIYSVSDDVPEVVNNVIARLQDVSAGLRIPELILQIASELQKCLADGSREKPFDLEDDDEMDEDGSIEEWESVVHHDHDISGIKISPDAATMLNKRIRQDLRAVRNAGFKVGILRGMKADCSASILSISIQVVQLGLSDEALQAWDLQNQEYVVLLIRYRSGYKTFEAVISEAARNTEVDFRLGLSNRYKPTALQAMATFTEVKVETGSSSDYTPDETPRIQAIEGISGFRNCFISSSLNNFVNEQFTSLLKIRQKTGIGWDGAKRYFNDNQGRIGSNPPEVIHDLYSNYYSDSITRENRLPPVVTADHIRGAKVDKFSFPLVAIQFCMRYLTRCTEFCLICHDRTEDAFEALKPYVCSKPLCLYQYMHLGFGPSVEHEILTQPYVADLLISFCYASVKGRRIREYPTGMSLTVPASRDAPLSMVPTNPFQLQQLPSPSPQASATITDMKVSEEKASYEVKYDPVRQEVVLSPDDRCSVQRGDWIILTSVQDKLSTHHKVVEVLRRTIRLSTTVVKRLSSSFNGIMQSTAQNAIQLSGPALTPSKPHNNSSVMQMTVYNRNFDELSEDQKAEVMLLLLETIPSIKEMRTFLMSQKHLPEPNLSLWFDRFSPAALGLLRWIIASNRSCIVQVDTCPGQDDGDDCMNRSRPDEKVSSMDGWVQFRFAQGAPDKEHRFHKALEDTRGRHNPDFPTLFAWHGSGLQNWHSIIRSGLDFKDTLNGRACGHGCYHSLDYSTSLGYCMNSGGAGTWPGSDLKIVSAMCLNEIVNVPQEYICRTPHLVVQHIDWIQCRYLFVRVGGSSRSDLSPNITLPRVEPVESPRNVVEIELDKSFTPNGINRTPLGIPRNAFPASRKFKLKSLAKARALYSLRSEAPPIAKTGYGCDDEDIEDLNFLISDDEDPPPPPVGKDSRSSKLKSKGKGRADEDVIMLDSDPRKRAKSEIDFVPGSLDQATLNIMEPPTYATSQATQVLNRELKSILKVQDTIPLHELGWYINKEMVQNVYQWIVELHSFDPDLPLSKDMRNAGIKSVVLEIRFGKDYPVSPPFVRVIRPRFLPFMLGGGGHVTGGGAMCMELLTNSGWSPVSSIESVLLQVRMAIMNLEPKPARLEAQGRQTQRDYGVAEAMEAYVRACRAHGWQVPKDFNDFALGGSDPFGI